ncbi:ParB/RepB/Spo0J family partition protein [Thermodesulfobacteriota bacterium]
MNWLDHTHPAEAAPGDVDLEDRTCLVPCFTEPEPLAKSIKMVGVLNPPMLRQRRDGTFVPVLGRRRLKVARDLGMPTVQIRIIGDSASEAELFSLAVWDNLGHRPFDQACTAFVIRRLLELLPREVVATRFLPVLGVPAHGPRLERMRILGGLEENILEALAQGKILEKTALVLARMDHPQRLLLFGLTRGLVLNTNKSAEVIEHLFDLSMVQGRTVSDILATVEMRSILDDPRARRHEKGQRLRELLLTWKFPELLEKQARFDRTIGKLADPPKITVRHSPGFEDERCSVMFNGNSWDEAAEAIARLKEMEPRESSTGNGD